MFKCDDCGLLFDEPRYIREPHGEYLSHCPACGGSFSNVYECEVCGAEYTEGDVCPTCQETMAELAEDFISEVKKAFRCDHAKALDIVWDYMERMM